MSRLTTAKAALALTGALIFGYGVRVDAPEYRWAGIGTIAAALVLRLVARLIDRRDGEGDEAGPSD